jgi:ABC-type multidrug transport system ATPase subunit
MLDEIVKAGRTVILTTHDLEQGLRAATRVLIMDRGNIVLSADAHDPAIRETYSRLILTGARR